MSKLFSFRNTAKPTAFKADASDGVLTLEIYDAIGADFFGEGITGKGISAAIGEAGEFSSILLRLNSPGGDLFEGVAIYNLLKSQGKPVNVMVDGLAASAASLIAMAGETCIMGEGSCMMIHQAMGMVGGYAADMRQTADILDTVTSSAADIYVARTGMKKDEVMKMMEAETWMTPQEAIAKGFATKMSDQKSMASAHEFNLSVFAHVPVSMQGKTKEVDGEHLTAGSFIWVGDPDKTDTWALPWHFSTEEKTKSHLRDALARFDQEEKIPASEKPEAHAKLVRLCKEHGIEVSSPSNDVEDPLIDIFRKQLEMAKRN